MNLHVPGNKSIGLMHERAVWVVLAGRLIGAGLGETDAIVPVLAHIGHSLQDLDVVLKLFVIVVPEGAERKPLALSAMLAGSQEGRIEIS